MSIDWKLFRTLILSGVILILVHNIVNNWSDFKRGVSGGFSDGFAAGKAAVSTAKP